MKYAKYIKPTLRSSLFVSFYCMTMYAVILFVIALFEIVAKEPMFANNPIAVPVTGIYLIYLTFSYSRKFAFEAVKVIKEAFNEID
jgi:hypothetical protein